LKRLHTYGLLSGSFRPDDQVCVLRSYWRHRANLVRYASKHIQHMQKALTEMNLHLHKVLSSVTSVTGMNIIRAIIAGERDPQKLALMREPGVKNTAEVIAKALEGDYRKEHLFALRQAVERYDLSHRQVEACDREIKRYLHAFEAKVDPLPKQKGRRKKPIDFVSTTFQNYAFRSSFLMTEEWISWVNSMSFWALLCVTVAVVYHFQGEGGGVKRDVRAALGLAFSGYSIGS
jgi:hypothetical protein